MILPHRRCTEGDRMMPQPRMGVPIIIRGVYYRSQREAARHLGVTQPTISAALDNGTLDNVGLGKNCISKKRVWLNGQEFESRAALARHASVPATTLNGRILAAQKAGLDAVETEFGTITWGCNQ